MKNFVNLELFKKYSNSFGEIITIVKHDVDENIIAISIKLERSEGGVRGEIRKMIIFRYLMGDDSETITDDMNLPLSYTKMIIKNYLDKDAEADIIILKRENELLKLRVENVKLQNSLKNEVRA